MSTKAQWPGGKSGIVNLGNTCYLNTALQVLSVVDDFRDFWVGRLTRVNHKDHIMIIITLTYFIIMRMDGFQKVCPIMLETILFKDVCSQMRGLGPERE